jgi:photosystem II stability/assembly factor-like uncharacterized protein
MHRQLTNLNQESLDTMSVSRRILSVCLPATILLLAFGHVVAQPLNPDLLRSLRWRNIGPYRGGRVRAISGVPSQPNVFYMAQVNGGVWKTTDSGRTWKPIFDDQPTGSIGSIAVAVSDPNIIYAGSGEGLQRPDLSVGDGIYKSTDAGKTWTHLGLRDGQQIPQIAIDPHNADHILVAVAGHPYGPNEERGIFRSMDGGKTFDKVLYKDENTGAADVLIDPQQSNVAYAALWEARQGPWENGVWNGTGGGIFKSTDGGKTWTQLAGGLPEGIIQANLAIAPSSTKRLFASVATAGGVGLYRSDDAGATWTLATTDTRPAGRIGGGDLPVPRIDPKNPDTIYSASTVCWRSVDAGKTWTAFRGAPGGDDYQNVWINPTDTDIVFLASDQGAVITVNGGRSFSSWYNQSTAQLYHVTADNAFPYRLCGGQQESGSACVPSRGDNGQITFRDWSPVGAQEYGYVAPDPLDPDLVYGGKLTRFDRRTGQVQVILPRAFQSADYRMLRTQPVVFSPVDPHVLYFSSNTLWMTKDGGRNWEQISPDLTRKTFEVPENIGKYRAMPTAQATQRGVIYAVAPSFQSVNRIWAGTDDGLIHITDDGGKTWRDITPPQLKPFWKVSIIDAGHFHKDTAYAAINTLRLDDLRPHIFRTRDGGATWTEIVDGIPQNENVDVVREDPERKGLLFAGTERAVYVSFDDGDHWQSLRLNMPASSVRDLIIKGDDLCVATHGRGFWILDNITPLRQMTADLANAQAVLFRPQPAWRVRWNMNTDTPLPPDEATGENPPDGAMIDYYLGANTRGEVILEIKDESGKTVRRYSSTDPVIGPDATLAIPRYWVRPPLKLSNEPGMHRFLWDLHHAPVPGVAPQYPIAAIYMNTAPAATAPWALPGKYTAILTVGGKSYSQPFVVAMDPRVKTSPADLAEQFKLSRQIYEQWIVLAKIGESARQVREHFVALRSQVPEGELKNQFDSVAEKLQTFGGTAAPVGARTLGLVTGRLRSLFAQIEGVDLAPTAQVISATAEVLKDARELEESWKTIASGDLPALNAKLKAAGLSTITVPN